jgi:acetyltransferase
MHQFFNPRGVAVVGATPNPNKGGNAILKNLVTGFPGTICPVNPRYREIEGIPCFPSLREVPDSVDLAILFVPAPQVLSALEEGAERGIRSVIVESGGFAETGPEGRALQERMVALARDAGIRIWGPNCMGLVDAVRRYVFSFMDPAALQRGLVPGDVSLVVQSGLLSAGFLVDLMTHGVMGISKACSIGNKADVDENDLLSYLASDPDTKIIGMYLESFRDGRRFVELCRTCPKPVVVLKGGRSTRGARAAMSHTASLAGNHAVIAGALAQAGVTEARDFKQWMDLCRSLAAAPPPAGGKGRIAVLTFSGGAGILSADFMEDLGLEMADLSADTAASLQELFPPWMPVSNPVDVWPAMEKNAGTGVSVYGSALQSVLADPGVDGVLLMAFIGNFRITMDLEDLAAQSRKTGKPVFLWLLGTRDGVFEFQKRARSLGVPAFQELYRAVECLEAVLRERPAGGTLAPKEGGAARAVLSPEVEDLLRDGRGPLDELRSKRILRSRGIPTVEEIRVASEEECLREAARIGFPVVLKGLKPGLVHKSEAGLVRLNIAGPEPLGESYRVIREQLGGEGEVLVQRQVRGSVELIAGMVRDPQFGPCVLFGLGGTMTEVLRDTAFAVAPLGREEALCLIGRIRGQALLDGFRGGPAVDREKLAEVLVALGELGMSVPRIREIDVNPLLVSGDGLWAVDATVVLD